MNRCSNLQGSYPFAFHLCNVDMNARVGTEKGNGYPWISAQLLLLSFLKTIILENARFLLVLSSLQNYHPWINSQTSRIHISLCIPFVNLCAKLKTWTASLKVTHRLLLQLGNMSTFFPIEISCTCSLSLNCHLVGSFSVTLLDFPSLFFLSQILAFCFVNQKIKMRFPCESDQMIKWKPTDSIEDSNGYEEFIGSCGKERRARLK